MSTLALYPTTLEAFRALGSHYGPAMEQAAAELGLPSPGWYAWLLPALTLHPEPISAARLHVRFRYTSLRLHDERLAEAAKMGFLTQIAGQENEYRLTERGRQAAGRVVEAAYATMTELQPMPSIELERLASLLHRLVESSLGAPEPPGKWCITHSRRIDPGDDASVLVRIDQYLSDLIAYRDDSHLAAWQQHGVEGHTWEALTYLWRGEARTLDGLYQKLERRGYSRDEYREALQVSIERGWVREEAGEYQATVIGREIRQAAQEATDRSFYGPWACLDQEETAELQALLVRLGDSLRSLSRV